MPNYLYYPWTELSSFLTNSDGDYVVYMNGLEFSQWIVPGTLR